MLKAKKRNAEHARNVRFFCIRKINIMEKTCKQCRCKFETEYKHKKFCTQNCAGKWWGDRTKEKKQKEIDDLRAEIERLKSQLNSKT
jgi:hypothetical protein